MSSHGGDFSRFIDQVHETTGQRADGSEFPAEFRLGPIKEHPVFGFVGIVRDISVQTEAESNRIKDRDRLDLLLNASPIVIYTGAASGSFPITYVSPNAKQVFGYDPDIVSSAPAFWPNRIHPEDRDGIDADRKSLRKNGRNYLEYRLKRPDGSYRWISDTQSIVCDKDGKPALLVGSWADIHEKKVAELDLALSEERLRISLECNSLASWDWVMRDSAFNWSENMPGKLGLEGDSATGFDRFFSTIHSEDKAEVEAAFRQALVSGEPLDEEYRVVWPDRSVHWVRSKGGVINDEQGNPLQIVGILYDISDQKQLRPAPRMSVKMREAKSGSMGTYSK